MLNFAAPRGPGFFWRLRHQPREVRDTLFCLFVVAWVLLPTLPFIPFTVSIFAAALLLIRGWLAFSARPLPGRWVLAVLLALAVAEIWRHYKTILGAEAGTTLVVILLALKTLELRARRDALVIFFLGFFTILTGFMFSQSLLTAVCSMVGLLGLLTALANAHMPAGRPALSKAMGVTFAMAALGAPVVVALYTLFPRFEPLWGVPNQMVAATGLSDTMSVGSIASLAMDGSTAFRVRFDTPGGMPPPENQLYFRGPVLSLLRGREWSSLPVLPVQATDYRGMRRSAIDILNLEVFGAPVEYDLYLEPHHRQWLLLMDAVPETPDVYGETPFVTRDLQWATQRPVGSVRRIQARSYPLFRYGPGERSGILFFYTDLPRASNPRTRELAQQLLAQHGGGNTQALVEAVWQRLRTGGYTYTLRPPVYGVHTADEFWFDHKAGFCEHIASSFVILMRAMDIPARIVTGYQGGEVNPVDGLLTVRQSDAHAWAEVWSAEGGWQRVDPTAAIDPSRIDRSQEAQRQMAGEGMAGLVMRIPMGMRMRQMWEAINSRWDMWIIEYTQEKQMNLLRALGISSPRWWYLVIALVGVTALACLSAVLVLLWRRNKKPLWLRLLAQAQGRLVAAGMPVPASGAPATPRAMADWVRAQFGGQSSEVAQWLLRMEQQRYGRASASSLAELRQQFGQLPWPGRKT